MSADRQNVRSILAYWSNDARERGHNGAAAELEQALAAINELIAAEAECEAAKQQQRQLGQTTNPLFYTEADLRLVRLAQRRLLAARARRLVAFEQLGDKI